MSEVFFRHNIALFSSIGLPMVIFYILFLINLVENRNKNREQWFSLIGIINIRDLFIVTVSLDVAQIMIELDTLYMRNINNDPFIYFNNANEYFMTAVFSSLLLIHLLFFVIFKKLFYDKLFNLSSTRLSPLSQLSALYAALLFLFTNGITISALIGLTGGVRG